MNVAGRAKADITMDLAVLVISAYTEITSMRKTSRPARKAKAKPDDAEIRVWVEHVAAAFAQHFGLPPITGRILGWLLICDPPEQSAGEIADAIGASRASLTTSMRLLTSGDLVRRSHRPGERTTWYRIDDDAWEKVIRRRIAGMASLREVTEAAMALVGRDSPRASRVRAAHAFFGWLSEAFAARRPPGI
jgi:DNA-binding MarR family transcriptional regulator